MDTLIKNFTEYDFLIRLYNQTPYPRILNAGSASVKFSGNCVNVDIVDKPGVDIVCDIHNLPADIGKFDAIICVGVLQYCHDPKIVAKQFWSVLNPGGLLFVDAPWVQPFCEDTTDKFRFSSDGLKLIFSDFEIIKMGPSIRPGSAFFMLGTFIAGSMFNNRYINFILRKLSTIMLWSFKWIKTANESKTAGAFYLIGQKPR